MLMPTKSFVDLGRRRAQAFIWSVFTLQDTWPTTSDNDRAASISDKELCQMVHGTDQIVMKFEGPDSFCTQHLNSGRITKSSYFLYYRLMLFF